jgi:serine phosphatase RsbU (regulator of sigma subunit)
MNMKNFSLEYLIGGKKTFTLERRILNAVILFTSLSTVFFLPVILYLGIGMWHFITVSFIGVTGFTFYFLSRFRNLKINLFFVVSAFVLLSVIWFTGYGSRGYAGLFFIFPAMFSLILLRGRIRIVFFLLTPVLVAALTAVEAWNPGLVKHFHSEFERKLDFIVNYVIWILLVGLIMRQIIDSYYEERTNLADRNRIMEEELSMAREIQQQLVPGMSPVRNAVFFFKPMEKIGGDFFDLFLLNGDRLGIFLSDVSGHGVPAALVTSMIKSFILQSGNLRERPAEFLAGMNELLYGNTGGNFVTAFYGIYGLEDRAFEWANAGHCLPYLVDGGNPSALSEENRRPPLGVRSNEDLEKHGRLYSDARTVIPAGSRLVLFTDGLTEARGGLNDRDFFGDERLQAALGSFRSMSGHDYISMIVAELYEFRGGGKFDDDICIICLDS